MAPFLNLSSEELLGHLPALQVRETWDRYSPNIPRRGTANSKPQGSRRASRCRGQGEGRGSAGWERGPWGRQHSQARGGRCQEGQEQEAGQRAEDGGDDDHVTTAPPWPRVDGGWRLPCTQQLLRGCPWTPGQSRPHPGTHSKPDSLLSPPTCSSQPGIWALPACITHGSSPLVSPSRLFLPMCPPTALPTTGLGPGQPRGDQHWAWTEPVCLPMRLTRCPTSPARASVWGRGWTWTQCLQAPSLMAAGGENG